MSQHTPLSPYRVVELSSERTTFCGQILRDLGAEVITVEPLDGSDARRFGPYANDTPGLERSLAWWAHNRDKRSLALDVGTDAGRDILSRLLDDADFLVEGVEPERQAGLGLDDATLASRFPRLIAASITPFGREGPKAAYRGGELIALAASTLLSTWGDNDRPPVMMAVPQAYAHAGAEAAVGCMVALNERAASGLGQRVEATAQTALPFATQCTSLSGLWGAGNFFRWGGGLKFGPLGVRFIWPCKDGYVSAGLFFGSAIGPPTNRFTRLMYDRGFCDASIRDKDFVTLVGPLMSGEEPMSEFDRCQDAVERFCAAHTRAEMEAYAVEHDLLIDAVRTTADLLTEPQLQERGYFRQIDQPGAAKPVTVTGPFARFSETPLEIGGHAPSIGEHTREVLRGDLGMGEAEIEDLRARGVIGVAE